MDTTKVCAFAATIHVGLSTAIEGYVLRDGTFRYSPAYVSRLLGYAKNYVSQVSKSSKKKLEALQSRGFTGEQIALKVPRSSGGASYPKSISFDDFCILVEYEAVEVKNPKAIALLTASFREVLRGRTQEAFKLAADSFEQRVVRFEMDYQQYLEDVEEVQELELYGDEELTLEGTWWGRLAKRYDIEINEDFLHLNYEG